MRIIARKMLKDFWKRYPDAQSALQAWFHEAKEAVWKSSADVKTHYASASVIDAGRVVFNICSNKYRLVVRINYRRGIVYTRFIGTHSAYDKIDVRKI
jgi:mRNA interferase HigB